MKIFLPKKKSSHRKVLQIVYTMITTENYL
jgi:hypothetical protein